MADSMAPRMMSFDSCFSSSTSLKARANSFFVMLDRSVSFYNYCALAVYKQKSGGYPLLGDFDIEFPYARDFSTTLQKLQDIINRMATARDMKKAALRGEPSYVWRAGQQRRLEMILRAASGRIKGRILENG